MSPTMPGSTVETRMRPTSSLRSTAVSARTAYFEATYIPPYGYASRPAQEPRLTTWPRQSSMCGRHRRVKRTSPSTFVSHTTASSSLEPSNSVPFLIALDPNAAGA